MPPCNPRRKKKPDANHNLHPHNALRPSPNHTGPRGASVTNLTLSLQNIVLPLSCLPCWLPQDLQPHLNSCPSLFSLLWAPRVPVQDHCLLQTRAVIIQLTHYSAHPPACLSTQQLVSIAFLACVCILHWPGVRDFKIPWKYFSHFS